jgi:small subunit ribosomal protein S6
MNIYPCSKGLYYPKGGKKMSKYESIIIVRPEVSDEARTALIEKFTGIINNGGTFESIDEIGMRKLAYEVKKQKEGYYILFNFEAETSKNLIEELERNYRITDEILKFITVKK